MQKEIDDKYFAIGLNVVNSKSVTLVRYKYKVKIKRLLKYMLCVCLGLANFLSLFLLMLTLCGVSI